MKGIIILIVSWGVWNLGDVALKHRFCAWVIRVTGNVASIKDTERNLKKQGLTDGEIIKYWYSTLSKANRFGNDHLFFPLLIAAIVYIFVF